MTTPVKPWLDNAILQSVAESYLELLPDFGGDRSLEVVLTKGVNHPILNPDKINGVRNKWGQRRFSKNFNIH